MISLSLFKVNFDELNINNLSKRALLESLKVFYKADELAYLSFLEELGIDYYKKFNNIFELNNELNKEIKIFNNIASKEEIEQFDFKAINLFKRSLKEINDNEYVKVNFDLRRLNDSATLSAIKDIFIITDSVSLVDFKEIEDERVSLIYHRRGALIYNDELILSNSRDAIQFLENFKVPKDNNFILTRFLLEISKKFKEAGIDESFSYTYQIGETKREVVKDIDEIIFWGNLSKEEKEEIKQQEKEKQEIEKQALELAKNELKKEKNDLRASLKKDSTNEILENEKSIPNIYNLKFQEIKSEIPPKTKEENENRIEKIITESFAIYHQKEIEKANIRLERAKKDSFEAYKDLKECLNQGLSITEAIKSIQQKYRNEDTINFASLLFSRDILNLSAKEDEIKDLKNQISQDEKFAQTLNEELTKREETISKLKGTIQLKINEMTQMKMEFEEELEAFKESDLKLKELEKIFEEQKITIEELDKENESLNQNNKDLKDNKIRLEVKLENAENLLKEEKEKEQNLQNKIALLEEVQMQNYKFKFEIESLEDREKQYLERIKILEQNNKESYEKELELTKSLLEKEFLEKSLEEYKKKVEFYENKHHSNENAPHKEKRRSRDILGEP